MKAILVVDIGNEKELLNKKIVSISFEDGDKIYDNFESLKPMPQKRKIENYMECWQRHYIAGINDTISRIEGTLIQTHSED